MVRDNRSKSQKRKPARRNYIPKRKVCAFCVERVKEIDYKNVSKLQRYISDRGKIEPRRKTGVCSKHQRALATAIKRARHIALLSYTTVHMHRMKEVSSQGGVGE
jgi:small subunit ribosomal protein S18